MDPPNPPPANPITAQTPTQTDEPDDLNARIQALQARLDAMHPLPVVKSSQTSNNAPNTAESLTTAISASASLLPDYKRSFLHSCLSAHVLTFGIYTLKSGRRSPYFFNAGLFHRASLLRSISSAYAHTLITYSISNPGFKFDIVFGPAYKGIPLATATVDKLAELDERRYGDVSFSFNRKEAKDHGEGGSIVGAGLRGKRVLVLDDVITAGTAMREACGIIAKEGGSLVGVIVALDRMERMPGDGVTTSAIGQVRREFGVPVLSIITLNDLIKELRGVGGTDLTRMEEYKRSYGASD
jgi:orotate phosphoribosyltransferase